MMRLGLRRSAFLRAVAGVLAAAWVAFLGLGFWPAWQARTQAVDALRRRGQELVEQQQVTASLPAVRARLVELRAAVAGQEAHLAAAGSDTAAIRAIEALAGPSVTVTTLSAAQRVPVRPSTEEEEASDPPYWQIPCRVEATGGRDDLLAFLRALEREVAGLRIQSVLWQAAAGADGGWHLSASGSLYLVAAER